MEKPPGYSQTVGRKYLKLDKFYPLIQLFADFSDRLSHGKGCQNRPQSQASDSARKRPGDQGGDCQAGDVKTENSLGNRSVGARGIRLLFPMAIPTQSRR